MRRDQSNRSVGKFENCVSCKIIQPIFQQSSLNIYQICSTVNVNKECIYTHTHTHAREPTRHINWLRYTERKRERERSIEVHWCSDLGLPCGGQIVRYPIKSQIHIHNAYLNIIGVYFICNTAYKLCHIDTFYLRQQNLVHAQCVLHTLLSDHNDR